MSSNKCINVRLCHKWGYFQVLIASTFFLLFVEFDTKSQVKDSYLITPETLIKAKPGMIVMHPLPRVNEIRSVQVFFVQQRFYSGLCFH